MDPLDVLAVLRYCGVSDQHGSALCHWPSAQATDVACGSLCDWTFHCRLLQIRFKGPSKSASCLVRSSGSSLCDEISVQHGSAQRQWPSPQALDLAGGLLCVWIFHCSSSHIRREGLLRPAFARSASQPFGYGISVQHGSAQRQWPSPHCFGVACGSFHDQIFRGGLFQMHQECPCQLTSCLACSSDARSALRDCRESLQCCSLALHGSIIYRVLAPLHTIVSRLVAWAAALFDRSCYSSCGSTFAVDRFHLNLALPHYLDMSSGHDHVSECALWFHWPHVLVLSNSRTIRVGLAGLGLLYITSTFRSQRPP